MKRLYLPLILLLLLVLEGVALDLLPINLVAGKSLIIPHWIFVFLLFIAIFYDRDHTYFSVFYAVIFGLLVDVVYTGVIGVYMFSYAIVIYIVHALKKSFHTNIYVTILIGIIGVGLTEISINFIYTVINIIDIDWKQYVIYRLMPTILANLIFLIILYPFVRKKLLTWQHEHIIGKDILQ